MTASRRGFMGWGLGSLFAGPNIAKEMVDNMKNQAVRGGPPGYPIGYGEAQSTTKEPTFTEIQETLNRYKKRLNDGEDERCKEERINCEKFDISARNIKSLKSVSKVHRMSMFTREQHKIREANKIDDARWDLKEYVDKWLKKYPFLKI